MHPGVRRFEVRIGVWAIEAAITPHNMAETSNPNPITPGTSQRPSLSLMDTLTQTLTTHLSNVPQRMPYLTSLSISSFLPVCLCGDALTASLFPTVPSDHTANSSALPNGYITDATASGVSLIPSPEVNMGLQNLVSVTLPRFFTTATIIQSLSLLPNLKTLEFQYDER